MEHRPDIVAVMVGVAVEGPYSYRVPPGMAVLRGSIVSVPLGPRLTLGVVWGPPKDMVAHNRLKDIAYAYEVPPLSEELLKLVEWVARYTLAAPGQVLRAVLRSTEALDAPRPVVAYRRTGFEPEKLTPARLRVLDALNDGMAWPKPTLIGAAGVSVSVIEGLERAGAVERLEMAPPPIVLPPDPEAAIATLNVEQRAALEQITALDPRQFGVALLDGVTGGGKTEVFFEAVADTLASGAAGADPAAGNRADAYVSGAIHQTIRDAAGRVAFGHDAGAARKSVARGAGRHGAGGGGRALGAIFAVSRIGHAGAR